MKSLFKNSVFNILYTVSNVLFPLLISMIVSRALLVEGVGKVAFAQNIASYFVTAAALGLPVYGIREIAKYKDDQKELDKVYSELFIINLICSVIAIFGYGVCIYSLDLFRDEISLYLCCGLNVVLNIFNIDWFYKGKEEYRYIVIRSVVVKILSLIMIALFVKSPDDYIIYAFLSALAIAGNYVFNVINVRKYVSFTIHKLKFKRHYQPLLLLATSVFFATLYSKIDITLLGIISDDSAVGIYSNAHKSINILLSMTTAITAVFLPRLSSLYEKDSDEFFKTVNNGSNIIVAISVPMLCGTAILAPYIINILFGKAFGDAAITLQIFTPLIIICSLGDLFCYQLIIATGNEKKRVVSNFIGAFINICLNIILIPLYRENGAAIATVISELLINIYLYRYVCKTLNVSIQSKMIRDSITASIIMSIIVFSITNIVIPNILKCIIATIMGVMVYFITMYKLKNDTMRQIVNIIKLRIFNIYERK